MTAIESALDTETSQLLVDSITHDKNVLALRFLKAQTNLSEARPHLADHTDGLLKFEDRLLSVEYNITKSSEPASTTSSSTTMSSNPEPTPRTVIDELNMLYNDLNPEVVESEKTGVRNQLDKLDANSCHQEQLSSDLVAMAATIKQNAVLFQQKLETDSDLLGTTTSAIHQTAGNMSGVGARLKRYQRTNQIGLFFTIKSVIFIILCLLVGMAMIQVLGKW